MTDEELKNLVASLAVTQAETSLQIKELKNSQAKTDEQMKKTDEQMKKTDEQMKKTDEQIKETDRQIKMLGRQIGGLGNKFGGFTEGMAFPSMKKILEERFKMSVITTNVRSRKNGKCMEIDVLAYSNTNIDEVYIVEVKSNLKREGLEQIIKDLNNFSEFFSVHRGKKLYGILAVVDSPVNLEQEVIKNGIYLAKIHDETFEIQVSQGFKPKPY